jgi:hypothetical protein
VEQKPNVGGRPAPKPAARPTPTASQLGNKPVGRVPPPAKLPPGVRGNPPLPVGKTVVVEGGVQREVSLTEIERQHLARAGLKPGDPIPANMAQLLAKSKIELAEVAQDARADAAAMPLPLPIDTPPMQPPKIVDESQLSPEKRKEVRAVIGQALQQQAEERQMQAAEAKLSQLPPSVQQGLAQAAASTIRADMRTLADRPRPAPVPMTPLDDPLVNLPLDTPDDIAAYERVVAKLPPEQRPAAMFQGAPVRSAGIDLGGPSAPPPPPPPPEPEPVPEPEPTPAPTVEDDVTLGEQAGAEKAQTNCPHCEWPLDMTDMAPPDAPDRAAFLHALLGQIPFQKEYPLFGGAVILVLRTLTSRELDAIFQLAQHQVQQGKIGTQADFMEHIQRWRLMLQITAFRGDGFTHELPDGLSPSLHPHAKLQWSSCNLPEPEFPGDVGILAIEKWLLDNVFRTEPIHRIAMLTCNRFNRFVAKLEALADNADFWRATESQS